MRGRHSSAIMDRIGVTETIPDSLDEYVGIATRLAADSEERRRIRLKIDRNKHKAYRDRDCIAALEVFLADAVRELRPEERAD
jgi:protein O-GlcNAc transferase